MVEIDVSYEGGLRCRATHVPSKNELITDAPADNMGKGEAFSPTDLVATALGTCMLTTMGIRAQERGWSLEGMRLSVEKHMTQVAPRRIAKLAVRIDVPSNPQLAATDRAFLEHTAHHCPVRISILEAIEVPVQFDWEARHTSVNGA